MSYKNFIIKIKKITPVLTEFQSDTVFGHLAWAIKYIYGEKKLLEFLSASRTQEPPIICSNAFPENYIAYPVLDADLSETGKKEIEKTFNEVKVPENNRKVVFKALKNKNYIHKSLFNRYKNGVSSSEITNDIFKGGICPKLMRPIEGFAEAKKSSCAGFNNCVIFKDYKECSTGCDSSSTETYGKEKCPANDEIKKMFARQKSLLRNAINRITSTVEKGKLFSSDFNFYNENAVLDLYIKISEFFNIDEIKLLFDYISKSGYGADSSTGSGAFSFEVEENNDNNVNSEGVNAFISLSNYSPRSTDPREGGYKVFTKYPKLSAALGHKNPFKSPVMLIKPGAVFKVSSGEAKEFYGRLIEGMAENVKSDLNIDIVQCGLTFPYFIKIKN